MPNGNILNQRDKDRIIEMVWECTPFEVMQIQFSYSVADVTKLMRRELKEKSFKPWRTRVNSGTSQKCLKNRHADINRFRCSRQRTLSNNKISK